VQPRLDGNAKTSPGVHDGLGALDTPGRTIERRQHTIPDRLHLAAAEPLQFPAHGRVVAVQDIPPPFVPQFGGQGRGTNNVGEQHGRQHPIRPAGGRTGKATAKRNLDGFAARLALYFSDIVNNQLAADPLTDAITMHDQHLIDHVEAYAAKRYDQAQQRELEGYQQMLGVADTLVGAIQKTVQPRLPVGAPQGSVVL
jgi:hypothetical protein